MTNSSQPDNSLTARLEESGGQMTFFEHLTELRKRIINSLYAIGIGAFIGVYISPKVIRFINEPMLKALKDAHFESKLYYNHPAGALNLVITLGVYIGIVLVGFWYIWKKGALDWGLTVSSSQGAKFARAASAGKGQL